jgi:hypothetical protein
VRSLIVMGSVAGVTAKERVEVGPHGRLEERCGLHDSASTTARALRAHRDGRARARTGTPPHAEPSLAARGQRNAALALIDLNASFAILPAAEAGSSPARRLATRATHVRRCESSWPRNCCHRLRSAVRGLPHKRGLSCAPRRVQASQADSGGVRSPSPPAADLNLFRRRRCDERRCSCCSSTR